MFSKIALLFVASMAACIAASPIPDNGGQCNTGSIQCCNSAQSSKSAQASKLTALLGIDVSGPETMIGFQCSPIAGLGLGGNSCKQAPMCCSNNTYNGLIVVGCTMISL